MDKGRWFGPGRPEPALAPALLRHVTANQFPEWRCGEMSVSRCGTAQPTHVCDLQGTKTVCIGSETGACQVARTPYSAVLKKLTVPQPVINFPTLHYGKVHRLAHSARHMSLSYARSILPSYFFETHFHIIFPSTTWSCKSFRRTTHLLFFSPIRATRPAHHVHLDLIP